MMSGAFEHLNEQAAFFGAARGWVVLQSFAEARGCSAKGMGL